ncbi:MAG: 23S rRNA (uracil(1939)-C(5))-methyltransferase RlmD [Saprospiraceae bacterium]
MGRRKKKPKLFEKVAITGIADRGRSVGRNADGEVIFVNEVAPGDVVDVLVLRKKKGVMHGVPRDFHELSPDRVEPFCQHYMACGGCKWQHISYEAQIRHKEIVVHDAMRRIAKVEIGEFLPILGADPIRFYRNKMEYTFSNKRWLEEHELNVEGITNVQDVLGFHRPGAFDKIIDIEKCWLQNDPGNEIRNTLRRLSMENDLPFFDLRENTGCIRQVMIRTNRKGEALIILTFYDIDEEVLHDFLRQVQAALPQVVSLYFCINKKVNDFIRDLPMHLFSGQPQLEENLRHVNFKIGPKSFFQTNTNQAENLYDIIVDFADLKGTENVYDLYTGLGSIALYVAKNARQVVGIEEVAEAIDDAKVNAAMNGIENCVFYAGDVKDILTPKFAETHGKPDLLITDPPRAGMHPNVVKMLLELAAPRLVYVSCNPATQARDLKVLDEKYRVVKMRPVDMFPHTHHIENVALLELKE